MFKWVVYPSPTPVHYSKVKKGECHISDFFLKMSQDQDLDIKFRCARRKPKSNFTFAKSLVSLKLQ